ncbi:MAG TPA: toll/interleukin-1 receptor domain-containing protein [Chloroflexia bacterium]|jgi:hypothetical protein
MANREQLNIARKGSAAWNEWREQHPLEKIDLSNATLSSTQSRADLRRANLREADLTGVFLTEADLTGADLTRADLKETDLTRTDLTKAMLFSTNFAKAHFDATDFSKARLARTVFADVDLSSVRGLEATKHLSPSIISIGTLYLSKGQIPEVFLRGAGVPEDFIKLIPLLTARPPQFYSCFISYSHDDKAFAHRLYDSLQARGIRCWLDDKDVEIGGDLYEAIDHGIRVSDKLLLCCSRASLTSWWVDDEIGRAFAKEQQILKDSGTRVRVLIPLDLDGYLRKEWADPKVTTVNRRLAADFKGWEQDNTTFNEQLERVVKALRTDQGAL